MGLWLGEWRPESNQIASGKCRFGTWGHSSRYSRGSGLVRTPGPGNRGFAICEASKRHDHLTRAEQKRLDRLFDAHPRLQVAWDALQQLYGAVVPKPKDPHPSYTTRMDSTRASREAMQQVQAPDRLRRELADRPVEPSIGCRGSWPIPTKCNCSSACSTPNGAKCGIPAAKSSASYRQAPERDREPTVMLGTKRTGVPLVRSMSGRGRERWHRYDLQRRRNCHLPGSLSVVLARTDRWGHNKGTNRKDTYGNGPW